MKRGSSSGELEKTKVEILCEGGFDEDDEEFFKDLIRVYLRLDKENRQNFLRGLLRGAAISTKEVVVDVTDLSEKGVKGNA